MDATALVASSPASAAVLRTNVFKASSKRPSLRYSRTVAATEGAGPTTDADVTPSLNGAAPQGKVVYGGDGRQKPEQPLRLQKVERLGSDSWAGVAAVDRGDDDATSLGRAALLVGGDAAAVLLFAAIGRGSHAELNGVAGVVGTAAPFLAGWFVSAYATGAFGAAAKGSKPSAAAAAAAKAWAGGIVLSLAIRSLAKGALPPLPFVVVSSVATATLLIGWRSALAAFVPKASKKQGGNTSGGPLEFLSLLGSLTKRW